MNILVESLPVSIEIDDGIYEINSDFRSCLRILLAFEDDALTPQEKQVILINNLYKRLPDNIREAVLQAGIFLDGGKGPGEAPETSMRLYSFSKDAGFIFSAFKQTHNIDLEQVDMHWWKFLALFMDLGQETTFCNLISLRKRINNGTATKEEKISAREMGDLFDVPEIDTRTLQEKEAERKFLEIVNSKGKQNG